MDWLTYALAGGLAICLIFLAISHTKMTGLKDRVIQMSDALGADVGALREELAQERKNANAAQERVNQWIAEKTEASTKLLEAEKRIQSLIEDRNSAIETRDRAIDAQANAERLAAVRSQEIEDIKKRMEDWETTKAQSLDAAKAAVLATSKELSSKLLEDHKRETDAAKKDTEERVKKTTEEMNKQFEGIVKVVAALNQSVSENKETMDVVWKALSTPGGAGQYSEIGLENSLKSFGLQQGRDFVKQQQIEGKRLRPDFIIFLPGDTVFVVDSKASKFLLDLARVEGTEKEAEAYKSFSRTMNQHLKDLGNKNYKEEILAAYRAAGRGNEIRRIMSIMYLHNEGAIDKLAKADPDFVHKAGKAEITIAGPNTLTGLIAFARIEIDLGRQVENQEKIVHATQAILDSVGVVIENTVKVGKGLKSASENYMKLANSINARLIPRVRAVAPMGIRTSRSKGIPIHIPSYQMIDLEAGDLIEGEAEEIGEGQALIDDSDESEKA